MEVKVAVLADFASLTREGKVNVLGILDSMSPNSLPASVPVFYLVTIFEASPAETK